MDDEGEVGGSGCVTRYVLGIYTHTRESYGDMSSDISFPSVSTPVDAHPGTPRGAGVSPTIRREINRAGFFWK